MKPTSGMERSHAKYLLTITALAVFVVVGAGTVAAAGQGGAGGAPALEEAILAIVKYLMSILL